MADLKLFLKDAVGLLKSGSQALALMGSKVLEYLYHTRVRTAGGITLDRVDMDKMLNWLIENDLYDDTKLLYLSNAGIVQRTDGVLKYVRTAFDASDNDNDLDGSATASKQPRLVGGIAPNSKPAASNQNGESRYFTHPTISFADNEKWTLTACCSMLGSFFLQGTQDNTLNYIGFISGVFRFVNSLGNQIQFNYKYYNYINKTQIITVVCNNRVISAYVNGSLIGTLSPENSSINYNRIGRGRDSFYNYVNNYSYKLQSSALTPTQVLAEYNLLRSLYPEIESVDIGTQTWASRNFEAVATPLGNVIANVTENGAVEKVTNAADREFSSDTGFWTKSAQVTIGSGVLNIKSTDGSFQSAISPSILTANKYYKLTYSVKRNAGGGLMIAGSIDVLLDSTVGDGKIKIYKSTVANLILKRLGVTDIDVDDVSIQELNWSNSTEIYDAVYTATAGTTAQKEYAALKEAAMWRYPSNNLDYGAVMSKQYNWYAAKLFQYDIDQYNIANPTATWGYHVATNQDYIDIATGLGGSEVAGKKMKMNGTTYWVTDNGTNESGITALGSGIIGADGVDTGYKEITGFWTADEYDADRGYAVTLHDQLDNLILEE